MYNLPYFKADDDQQVIDFMHAHPFITLTGVSADTWPVATHVPVLFEERAGKMFLQAHIMKHTDHHKAFAVNPNVLAIFSGAHTYVSASWYTNQQQASTWNYRAVHARGALRFLNESSLLDILHRLTARFENNPNSPSLVKHLDDSYINRLIRAIIGFEIEVTSIDHVFKLSQNRDKESYSNIIDHLKKGDSDAREIAGLMEQNGKT